MKIRFVDGTANVNGFMSIYHWKSRNWISGFYAEVGTRTCDQKTYTVKRDTKVKITIVKQKSIRKTLQILVHEFAHWFVFRFISRKSNHWLHDWIEDHI